MREIKFRAWVTSQDKPFMAVQGEPDLETLQSFIFHYGDEQNLMQFTGCRDKDGKEIYEGDILYCISRFDNANMVVIFEDGEFRMVLCEKYKTYETGGGFYAIRCFEKEVIGNIYDNPELLD
jgi:uncharacterized phage protein (TIGR01671 family)